MTDKVLFVDDEPNVLSAISRQLRRKFNIHTAVGGENGLEALETEGPFAAVVSDMRMPEMDGLQFLLEVHKRSPETVRMMLTGNADQETAINAINQGNIFRFYNKPCPPETLELAIKAGLAQYELVTAERTLLQKTLAGSLKVLVDVLSILDPQAFGRTTKMRKQARTLAEALKHKRHWELDMAVMLHPIGQIALPSEVATKMKNGSKLSSSEQEMVEKSPEIARNLIANIPRLERVAQIIYFQNKGFDGTGFPAENLRGKDIPEGARILKVLIDLSLAEDRSGHIDAALQSLSEKSHLYDPEVLEQAQKHFKATHTIGGLVQESMKVRSHQLQPGDKLITDIKTKSGTLVLSANHEISEMDIARIKNKQSIVALQEPIFIIRLVPEAEKEKETADA